MLAQNVTERKPSSRTQTAILGKPYPRPEKPLPPTVRHFVVHETPGNVAATRPRFCPDAPDGVSCTVER